MQKTIPQILGELSGTPVTEDRVALLRKYEDPGIKLVLAVAFDPNFTWDLPPGYPPTRRNEAVPEGYARNNLRGQTKTFYLYEKAYTNIKRIRKEMLFVDLLESLDKSDADLLVAIKDGQLTEKYPGVDEALVRVAFPGLLTEPKSAAKAGADQG